MPRPSTRHPRHPRTRALVAATAATVLVGALAACSSGGSAGGDDASTLTVWHYYTLDSQLELIDGYADTFAQTHPDVDVEYVYVPMDQLNSKIIAAVGAGTGPDVIVADGFNVGTLASANALAPMDEYWDAYADKGLFSEGAVKTVDGTVYGVQGHVNSLALWYNQDILDEVGVEPPGTVDELEDAMAAVVAAGYQGINLAGDPSIQGAFQGNSWLTSEGFSYADPSVDAAEAAFGRVRGWIDNGWLSAQAATWDQNVPFAEFMAGGVAFAQNGNWQASAMAADAPFEYGVVPLPLSSTGGTYLGGESESIGATSAHPDLAWDYLEATYLSAQGQLEALAAVGSIPTRSDAGEDEAITADPVLSAFATAIAEQGAPYPDPVIPAANVEKVLLAFAQNYSAALAGSLSPADAAQQMVTTIEPLLAG